MIDLKKHMNLLGLRVKDRVTGFEGVVTSVSFDLYGCIQCIVNPGTDKEGKPTDSHWFDIGRLEAKTKTPVMPRPEFEWSPEVIAGGLKGPAEKPRMNKV
jgi:hypothetical protein